MEIIIINSWRRKALDDSNIILISSFGEISMAERKYLNNSSIQGIILIPHLPPQPIPTMHTIFLET